MIAVGVKGTEVAADQWRDGRPVQCRQVVGLEEGVDAELPVDRRRHPFGSKKAVPREPVGVKFVCKA